jgi:hypothetical protein
MLHVPGRHLAPWLAASIHGAAAVQAPRPQLQYISKDSHCHHSAVLIQLQHTEQGAWSNQGNQHGAQN